MHCTTTPKASRFHSAVRAQTTRKPVALDWEARAMAIRAAYAASVELRSTDPVEAQFSLQVVVNIDAFALGRLAFMSSVYAVPVVFSGLDDLVKAWERGQLEAAHDLELSA